MRIKINCNLFELSRMQENLVCRKVYLAIAEMQHEMFRLMFKHLSSVHSFSAKNS